MNLFACSLSCTQRRFVRGVWGNTPHPGIFEPTLSGFCSAFDLVLFLSVHWESSEPAGPACWLPLFLCTSSQNSFPFLRDGNFKRERERVCDVHCVSSNLIECNCLRISKHWMVWREGWIAFQTELRFPNVSFSVCNYLKPYLNPIKEYTILIVICTNEVFAIVIAAMCVSAPINTPLENAVGVSHLVQFSRSVGWVSRYILSSSPLSVGPVLPSLIALVSALLRGILKALYLFTDHLKLGEIVLDKVGIFVFISLGWF